MPPRPRDQPRRRGPLSRGDLPEVFTPETVRQIDVRTLRHLAGRRNSVLTAEEQAQFDAAVREVMAANRAHFGRFGREGPGFADPALQRSYEQTRARLTAQAERVQATLESEPDETEDPADDVSLGELEDEVEETSALLTVLERIAAIEQQQLEHHQAQVLRDVRAAFFGALVSVAVIVAGVAPLVEADADDRRLILIWTLAILTAAGVVYAAIRAGQSRNDAP